MWKRETLHGWKVRPLSRGRKPFLITSPKNYHEWIETSLILLHSSCTEVINNYRHQRRISVVMPPDARRIVISSVDFVCDIFRSVHERSSLCSKVFSHLSVLEFSNLINVILSPRKAKIYIQKTLATSFWCILSCSPKRTSPLICCSACVESELFHNFEEIPQDHPSNLGYFIRRLKNTP